MKLTIEVPDSTAIEFEDGTAVTKSVQTMIRVPTDLRKVIEELAIEEDRSISNLAVRLMRAGLAQMYPNRKGTGEAS